MAAWRARSPRLIALPRVAPPFLCPSAGCVAGSLFTVWACVCSASAPQVVHTLKSLAEAGHTVVASIHQPRSSIFALFDDLVLLSEGELLYCGAADEVRGWECKGPRDMAPAVGGSGGTG